jgi:DNA-binding NarL/FixJ family response regulator
VGVTVVGHTTSPATGLTLVDQTEPDLLIVEVDASDGEVDGWECLSRAREQHPALKVIAVADSADERSVNAAFASGASAFCSKTADPADFASAVRQSFSHSIYLASSRVLPAAGQPALEEAASPAAPIHDLTRRELEILQLVAEGYSNSQLARMLWVTEQTVKFHLSNIYRKLDVANRTEASRWAQVNGLLPASPAPTRSAA